jgi:flagellar L-ring protein FlgH
MRPSLKLSALALMGLSLGACSTVKEAVQGPQLAPMGVPSAIVMQNQPVIAAQDSRPASSNTLWRNGARDFFNDQRAKRVGDILTVMIDIDDQAQTQNNTTHSRTNSYNASLPNVLGLESSLGKLLPNGYDPTNPMSANGSNTFTGNGNIKRSEKISLTMAAMVTGVLPNGNLIIQGRQEVKTNFDVRELTVAGIVRPEDISSANTIKHTQLAEARINYGGRGDISRNQKTPAAQSLMEAVSPF